MRAPFLIAVVLLLGCGKTSGEACREDSECAPGLECFRGPFRNVNGECANPEEGLCLAHCGRDDDCEPLSPYARCSLQYASCSGSSQAATFCSTVPF